MAVPPESRTASPAASASPTAWERWRLRWHFEQHRRRPDGFLLHGHHHHNYVVELREPLASIVQEAPGRLGKFRTRLETVQVLPRVWHEGDVLRALRPVLPGVPRVLLTIGRRALHSYVEGCALSETAPPGTPLGDETLRRIASLFGALAEVPARSLPPLPAEWSGDGDSTRFLQNLADFAQHEVHLRNRPRFGTLFRALGIPDDAMERFHRDAKRLHERPYSLLHADVHRANLLRRKDGGLTLVDWECALFGDPLHDLATHLVRMEYTPEERRRMTGLWRREMRRRGLADRLAGMESDLRLYLDFEYAQSVFPDTIRAAGALPPDAAESDFDVAAASVRRALLRAEAALELRDVPDHAHVKAALRSWHRGRRPLPRGLPAVRRGPRGR
ncbi:Predicted kinase, aminoglycoside phosphotransferase (APT) family [Streptomyces sp. WMMB 714]|uniref:phosphotransferase n=1 Tax=Streptomyces sp. WMMB 714 TaxID=1286822 RepID=UPI000695C202|nr:phosphotransferase [Streptomyces sp. WMMB 714]SCK50413.1 Predicted kinase, aminoglycoside phosphotransferase (APT) family [Streptomyces sp. WMMB 714]